MKFLDLIKLRVRHLKYIFRWALRGRYYNRQGQPVRCPICEGTDIFEASRDDIDGLVSEFACICGSCECEIGYWAYGHYDPSYRKSIFSWYRP